MQAEAGQGAQKSKECKEAMPPGWAGLLEVPALLAPAGKGLGGGGASGPPRHCGAQGHTRN